MGLRLWLTSAPYTIAIIFLWSSYTDTDRITFSLACRRLWFVRLWLTPASVLAIIPSWIDRVTFFLVCLLVEVWWGWLCRSFRVMSWMEWRVLYLQTGGSLGGG